MGFALEFFFPFRTSRVRLGDNVENAENNTGTFNTCVVPDNVEILCGLSRQGTQEAILTISGVETNLAHSEDGEGRAVFTGLEDNSKNATDGAGILSSGCKQNHAEVLLPSN